MLLTSLPAVNSSASKNKVDPHSLSALGFGVLGFGVNSSAAKDKVGPLSLSALGLGVLGFGVK